MLDRRRATLCFLSLLLCLATLSTAGAAGTAAQTTQPAASGGDPGPAALITGSHRITVYQTQVSADGTAYGLSATPETPGAIWTVSVLDMTNFGTVPQAISLTDLQMLVTDGDSRIGADASQGPSAQFGFTDVQPDGSATIPVDATIRIAAAFAVPGEALVDGSSFRQEPRLAFGDEQTNVASTVVAELNPTALPPVQPWNGLQGTVQAVPGTGTIEVNVAGAVQTVQLAGVTTPPTDGCFGAESSEAVISLSGGSIWVEDDPTSDGALVWYWDAGRGHLALMNQALVEQGFGAYDDTYDGTAYAAWLAAKSDSAKASETGLWAVCKGAGGEWVNPPTPTPVPTKTADEVRAEYAWPDIRNLVIRPQQFEGQKIAFQGEVFNIPAGQGDVFEFQVYVTTPTGETEAVYVYFDGDATGIYEGTWVTVYGVGDGFVTGTNAFGGQITQPLVRAEIIDR